MDEQNLNSFTPPEETDTPLIDVSSCLEAIKKSERPVLIIGWGVHLSKAREEALALIESLDIPVLLTWAMKSSYSYLFCI